MLKIIARTRFNFLCLNYIQHKNAHARNCLQTPNIMKKFSSKKIQDQPVVINNEQTTNDLMKNNQIRDINDRQGVAQRKQMFTNIVDYQNIRPKTKIIERLNKLRILPKKSITIEEFDDQREADADSRMRQLTRMQKQQLDLYIPSSLFNPRMTRRDQQNYRKQLCQNLYEKQQELLKTQARILQLSGNVTNLCSSPKRSECTVDQYVNAVYKDVFARYLINKGIGIQWHGKYSHYGAMNPSSSSNNSKKNLQHRFLSWFLFLLQNYPIQRIPSLYLYSFLNRQYIPISDKNVQIQNVYKIGHYLEIKLSGFGKFEKDFNILSARGEQIKLLVFLDDIVKIIDAKGIIFEPGKFIILKKYINQEYQEQRKSQYLITSMQIFSQHRSFFTKDGYTKHLLFNSEYLQQMQAELQINKFKKKLRIYAQIQGYRRKSGLYLFNSQTNLGDYDRSQYYNLIKQQKEECDIIDPKGNINIPKQLIIEDQENKTEISIFDPQYQQKLLQQLNLEPFPLHGTFQDQIYSYKNPQTTNHQKLHFRKIYRYQIQIPEPYKAQLINLLFKKQSQNQLHNGQTSQILHQKPMISESKIQIPNHNTYYHKPRDKRRHRKQIKKMKQQQTQYMNLEESLENVDMIPIDIVESKQYYLEFPILLKDGLTLLQYTEQIGQIILSTFTETGQQQLKCDVSLLRQRLNIYLQEKKDSAQFQIHMIKLSDTIIKGWQCLKDTLQVNSLQISDIKKNIVIQPQSKTEGIIPYFFHLFFMTSKLLLGHKKQHRGRQIRKKMQGQIPKNSQLENIFTMIKLHPTIIDEQKDRSISELIFGVLKLNNRSQYGYGLQAFRLWVFKNDQFLGDREIIEKQINEEIAFATFVRKLYWEILPLLQKQPQLTNNLNYEREYTYQQLPYLHQFISDHINYYIVNLEEALKTLSLSQAYHLTKDFFENYIHEIFVKTIRHRIITYPQNESENAKSRQIIKRIVELLPILQTLIPYSAYHISRQSMLPWPQIDLNLQSENKTSMKVLRVKKISEYNRMIKLRVHLRNKLILNKFHHGQIVINRQQCQNFNLSAQDLELFLNIDSVRIDEPTQSQKSFGLKISQNHPIGEKIPKLQIYEYKDVCFRCSPKLFSQKNQRRLRKGLEPQQKYLCSKCLYYLNKNSQNLLPIA